MRSIYVKLFVLHLFEGKRGDIVFSFLSVCPSIPPSETPSFPLQVVGTLYMQLLLQFYANSFDTLQVFRSWSEDMHIV